MKTNPAILKKMRAMKTFLVMGMVKMRLMNASDVQMASEMMKTNAENKEVKYLKRNPTSKLWKILKVLKQNVVRNSRRILMILTMLIVTMMVLIRAILTPTR